MRVISLFCFCWWILVVAGASGTEVSLEIYPAVELEFQTEIGQRYRLEAATNLATWEVVVPAQSAACNRVHPMTERCARWILLTHDRIGVDAFPLTHEFLSQMLGVRRATVTVATGALHQARLIRSHRGRITVLDRAGLESASCECYRVIRDEYDRLLGAGA